MPSPALALLPSRPSLPLSFPHSFLPPFPSVPLSPLISSPSLLLFSFPFSLSPLLFPPFFLFSFPSPCLSLLSQNHQNSQGPFLGGGLSPLGLCAVAPVCAYTFLFTHHLLGHHSGVPTATRHPLGTARNHFPVLGGNWGSERGSNLPRITQPRSWAPSSATGAPDTNFAPLQKCITLTIYRRMADCYRRGSSCSWPDSCWAN